MTINIGIYDAKNKVSYIGADSRSADSWGTYSEVEKIKIKNNFIMTNCGRAFLSNIVRILKIPKEPKTNDLTDFIFEKIACGITNLYEKKKIKCGDTDSRMDGHLLIGHTTGIYTIYNDLYTTKIKELFYTSGSGSMECQGYLNSIDNFDNPIEIMTKALRLTTHNSGCGAPFYIYSTKGDRIKIEN